MSQADPPETDTFVRAASNDASELDVQVVPRASRSRIVGPHAGRLKIQLAAPPVDGAANSALIELLADTLAVPRGQIELLRGHTGKRKTLRIALAAAELRLRLRHLGLGLLLLAAPACESQYQFPIHVVLPDDQDDLARADNLTLALAPQNVQVNFEVDDLEFNVGIELEPDTETSTLSVYLAEGTELLAWGRSAPFVLATPQDDLAVYLSPPGALSTFPGKIGKPDGDVLASPALGRGMLLFNSDGSTGLFNSFTLDTEVGAILKPEGELPAADDGALVPDSRGNVWRVAWAEALRAFVYVPGDNLWSAAQFTATDVGARAGAAHRVDASLERLLVFGGGDQRSVLEIVLNPDDAGDLHRHHAAAAARLAPPRRHGQLRPAQRQRRGRGRGPGRRRRPGRRPRHLPPRREHQRQLRRARRVDRPGLRASGARRRRGRRGARAVPRRPARRGRHHRRARAQFPTGRRRAERDAAAGLLARAHGRSAAVRGRRRDLRPVRTLVAAHRSRGPDP
jgi:uncharacterized protein (TIGR00251 family)